MRIRTRSIIILFSHGLIQGATVILGVILVRLISQQDFGTYRQVILVFTSVAGLLHLQFESSLYYFVPRLGQEFRRPLIAQTVAGSTTTGLLVTLGIMLFAEPLARLFKNPELVPLVRIFALSAIPTRINGMIAPFMISVDRAVRAGVYSLATVLLRLGAVVITVALGYGLDMVMWASVAALTLIAVVGLFDIARLAPGQWRLDRKLALEQLSYCWPLWATTIVAMLNVQFGSGVISTFFTPAMYAIYSCGAMEIPIVTLITGSVNDAIMPNLVTLADQGRRREALALWQEGIRKTSLIIFPCFGFFLGVASPLIILMYGQAYALAVWPFIIYLCLLPLRVAYYGSILRALGETRAIATGAAMGLVINAVLSVSLVLVGRGTLLAFVGPAIGACVAIACVAGTRLRQIARLVGVPFRQVMRWRELFGILAVSLGCALVPFLLPLPEMPAIADILARGVVFAAVWLLVLMYTRILTRDERHLLAAPLVIARRTLFGVPVEQVLNEAGPRSPRS